MPTYTVRLEKLLAGSPAGSTCDDFVADTPEDAERQAIEAWKKLDRAYTFNPVLTVERTELEES